MKAVGPENTNLEPSSVLTHLRNAMQAKIPTIMNDLVFINYGRAWDSGYPGRKLRDIPSVLFLDTTSSSNL